MTHHPEPLTFSWETAVRLACPNGLDRMAVTLGYKDFQDVVHQDDARETPILVADVIDSDAMWFEYDEHYAFVYAFIDSGVSPSVARRATRIIFLWAARLSYDTRLLVRGRSRLNCDPLNMHHRALVRGVALGHYPGVIATAMGEL